MRHLPVQMQIIGVLRARREPLCADEIASMLEIDTEQAERELSGLFINSKGGGAERRRFGLPPAGDT